MRLSREHTIHVYSVFLFSFLVCVFFAFPYVSHAQFSIGQAGLHLVADPQFPSPHTHVVISLDDYSLDTTGASIAWYVHNLEQKESRNERSITITTGGIGEKESVRVVLTRTNTPALSASIDILPVEIDIILEADTYVPYFYKGKALPSLESNMRAIAVVHDNSKTLDSAYAYKWSVGETVLSGGAQKGKNVIETVMPHYDNKPLTVEVFDSTSGKIIGKKSILLKGSTPELHFYEHSPLKGLSHKELSTPFALIGEETTIYAEPYFMNGVSHEQNMLFKWTIDGEPANHDTNTPNAITLRHVGGSGSADVGVSIVSKTQIPQFVEKVFKILFE